MGILRTSGESEEESLAGPPAGVFSNRENFGVGRSNFSDAAIDAGVLRGAWRLLPKDASEVVCPDDSKTVLVRAMPVAMLGTDVGDQSRSGIWHLA